MAPVVTCSALEGTGVDAIWEIISTRTMERERSGYQKRRRSEQDTNWMWSLVNQHMHDVLLQDPAVSALANDAAVQVRAGALSPVMASDLIIQALFKGMSAPAGPPAVAVPCAHSSSNRT
jgi:LAO/AO transport system kinase